jgi:hypothetical protein
VHDELIEVAAEQRSREPVPELVHQRRQPDQREVDEDAERDQIERAGEQHAAEQKPPSALFDERGVSLAGALLDLIVGSHRVLR